MAKWKFPSNGHGEIKGIGDSGLETFRGTPIKSLAREICQNTLDAGCGGTVEVEFYCFSLSPSLVPGSSELRKVFDKCIEFWKNQKSKITKEFFEEAIEKIDSYKISMLRISDFNTTGLKGSKKDLNTDWTNLTKSSGVSDKGGTAGGSFGIGKFAPFACSSFSTVFYNTYDTEEVVASQGVSRLVTFRDDDGETTQGIGYYGNERNTPVYESLDLDPNFSRVEVGHGTDIYIAGYKFSGDGWKNDIIVSIIDDFLGSIWNERLVVHVGEQVISKKTLPDLMGIYSDQITGYADKYYKVLTSNKTEWFQTDFMNYGIIKLGLLIGPEMHRKVAMLRKTGMKIMDRGNISGYIPFAGIMLIEGERINNILRKLENPQHTKWELERSNNPVMAKNIIKGLNDYIKECLEKLAQNSADEQLDAEGVGEYLPDDAEDVEESGKEETVSNRVKEIETKHAIRKHNSGSESSNDRTEKEDRVGKTDGEGGKLGYSNVEGKITNHSPRPPKDADHQFGGSEPIPSYKEIKAENIRVLCQNKLEGRYLIMLTPRSTAKGYLDVFLTAESGSYTAPIISASLVSGEALQVSGGCIMAFDFVKDVPVSVNIKIGYSDYCSMEVKVYGDNR